MISVILLLLSNLVGKFTVTRRHFLVYFIMSSLKVSCTSGRYHSVTKYDLWLTNNTTHF